jgi:hypothetical protein
MGICQEYLYSFGFSAQSVNFLLKECVDENKEKSLLLQANDAFSFPCDNFISKFDSKIWSLIPEFCVPCNLGWQPASWPILVYPFAVKNIETITEYLRYCGAQIIRRQEIDLSDGLIYQLCGGKKWFSSILAEYISMFNSYGRGANLLYFSLNKRNSPYTLAAIARKLQLIVRPQMPSFKSCPDVQLFLRAFHTPNLAEISIHLNIFKQKTTKE